MAIGFIRNEEEFTPASPVAFEEELDLEKMWDEALDPSSIDSQVAESEINRIRKFW